MNDASKFWQAVRDYNKEKEWYTMEVVKLDNKVRMKIRELENRLDAIEKKQAERFPHLIERLEFLENRQRPEIYNESALNLPVNELPEVFDKNTIHVEFDSDYPNW